MTSCLFHVRFLYAADDNSQFAHSGLTLKSKLLVELSKRTPPSDQWRAARDGAVVRALSSHQWRRRLMWAPGGGGSVLNKCLYREAPALYPTTYPFIYHFSRKRYPFRIPSIDKWYSFLIPCLELCIPFNCCKCTVF